MSAILTVALRTWPHNDSWGLLTWRTELNFIILVILALSGWTAFFESRLLLLPREEAMMAIVGCGLTLLAVLSYVLARAQQIPAWNVIAEHIVIGVSVIAITHFLGDWIHSHLS